MELDRHLILMGLRASGKSTIGRVIARRIGVGFVDLDQVTFRLMRVKSAAEGINLHGIDAFRSAESRALTETLNSPPSVLALGGGTPTAPGAASSLRHTDATTIYFRAQPDVLAARLAKTDLASRPSLTGRGAVEEVGELFRDRDPLYASLSSLTLDVDELSIDDAADRVIAFIEHPQA
ncbi:MAG: shikimate kinase [Phycisphaerae bacterium]|nr:shikimate kinase [Phycisphaerae bacterium]